LTKVFKPLGNVFLIILMILAISSFYSNLQLRNDPTHQSSIWGFKVMTVLTGSMAPDIQPGDVIVVKPIKPENAQVKDVITYRNSNNTLITHRIVNRVEKQNQLFFQTKGDANNVNDERLVSSNQLVGSLLFHIPKAGYVADFIKSPMGIVLFIVMGACMLIMGNGRKRLNNMTK
jgi:signal peptidase I